MLVISQLAAALTFVGRLLDCDEADYCFEGRFAFPLADDWSFVISADDAGRFRLEVCHLSIVIATMWCLADDRTRLEELVLSARRETALLAA